MERRSFLKYTAAAGLGMGLAGAGGIAEARGGAKLRKALQFRMLPKNLSDADKFKLARKCGYEGIEARPIADLDAAAKLGKLAREAGTPIHSVTYGGWGAPFSDPNPKILNVFSHPFVGGKGGAQKGLAGLSRQNLIVCRDGHNFSQRIRRRKNSACRTKTRQLTVFKAADYWQ